METLPAVLKEFGSYYEEQMLRVHPDLTPYRPDALRVSGFPYCGLRHAYKKLTRAKEVRTAGFGSKFYTTVGTITHEVVQEFLGLGGRIYGNWKCVAQGCEGTREFSKNSKCPKCKSLMLYEEFLVEAFKNVSGHIDGVFKTKAGKWYIVDYKTSSVKTIKDQKYTKTLPYKYNVAQIRAYAALIELKYEIEISGWILHYLARDDPARTHISVGGLTSTKSKALELKKIKVWDRHYDLVTAKVPKYRDIKILIEEKPCTSLSVYEKEYAAFDPCPLSIGGTCFAPKRLTEYMELTWLEMREKTQG